MTAISERLLELAETSTCDDHTPCPEGYIQWHAWAEFMSKTHRQIQCGECGLFWIWIPRAALRATEHHHGE